MGFGKIQGVDLNQDLGSPFQLNAGGVRLVNAAKSPVTSLNGSFAIDGKLPIVLSGIDNVDNSGSPVFLTGPSVQINGDFNYYMWNEDVQNSLLTFTPNIELGYRHGLVLNDFGLLVLSASYAYTNTPSLEDNGNGGYALTSEESSSVTFGAELYAGEETAAGSMRIGRSSILSVKSSYGVEDLRDTSRIARDMFRPLDSDDTSLNSKNVTVRTATPAQWFGGIYSVVYKFDASLHPSTDAVYQVHSVKVGGSVPIGDSVLSGSVSHKASAKQDQVTNDEDHPAIQQTRLDFKMNLPSLIRRASSGAPLDTDRVTSEEVEAEYAEDLENRIPISGGAFILRDLDQHTETSPWAGNYTKSYTWLESSVFRAGLSLALNVPVKVGTISLNASGSTDITSLVTDTKIPEPAEWSGGASYSAEIPLGETDKEKAHMAQVRQSVSAMSDIVEKSLKRIGVNESDFIDYWEDLEIYMNNHEIVSSRDFNEQITGEYVSVFAAMGYTFDEFMFFVAWANQHGGQSLAETKAFAPAFAKYTKKFAPSDKKAEMQNLIAIHAEKGSADTFRAKFGIRFNEYPQVVEWAVLIDTRIEDLSEDDMNLYHKAADWLEEKGKTFDELAAEATAAGETPRTFVEGL